MECPIQLGEISHAHIQAYCLVARADSQPKPDKELVLSTHEQTEKIKHETLTRYIKHLADSANFMVNTYNKHRNGLIGNRFEMPNVSYTHPLPANQRNHFEHHIKIGDI